MTITEQLTKKIGPLPVWAWGAIAAAGIVILRKQISAPPPTENLGSGLGMGGGYGTAVALPAGDAIPGQPAYGENLYLSFPWGDGYISVEGGAGAVAGVLQQIPLAPIGSTQTYTQPPPSPYDYYVAPPEPVAPSYVAPPQPQPAPPGCYAGTNRLSGRYTYYVSLSDCQAYADGCQAAPCL